MATIAVSVFVQFFFFFVFDRVLLICREALSQLHYHRGSRWHFGFGTRRAVKEKTVKHDEADAVSTRGQRNPENMLRTILVGTTASFLVARSDLLRYGAKKQPKRKDNKRRKWRSLFTAVRIWSPFLYIFGVLLASSGTSLVCRRRWTWCLTMAELSGNNNRPAIKATV